MERDQHHAPDILVEVSAGSSGDLSARPSTPEPMAGRADELAASIAEIASMLQPRLQDADSSHGSGAWALDEVAYRFDVSFTVGSGVLIGRATGRGTFTVRLTWRSARTTRE